ncbi:hypothetical protein [Streptomyces nigrescens]|nr:hypothetical protein [Streptomyces nigrescens]
MAISETSPTAAVERAELPVPLWAESTGREMGSHPHPLAYEAAGLDAGVSVRAVHADRWLESRDLPVRASDENDAKPFVVFRPSTALRTMRDHL